MKPERTNPSVAGLAAEEELRRHFSSKRHGARTELTHRVEVEGSYGRFRAHLLDISRSGALLRIHDPRFAPARFQTDLMEISSRLQKHFDDGLALHLVDVSISCGGVLARVTKSDLGAGAPVLVGCRFHKPLSPQLCSIIGIEGFEDKPD